MSGNNITSVKIRMYNTGSVGDCFLLLFQKGNTTSFSMMIDCGGIKTSSAAVTPCVEDIRQACNGKLDLLIVTHQHEDHLSGFNLARPVFDKISVNEVWMSWVENKDDPFAAILKKRYGKKLKELKQATEAAAKELKRHDPQNSEVAGLKKSFNSRMQGMQEALAALEFEMGGSHGAGLAAGRQTNEDAMSYVKGKGKKLNYRLPGEVLKNIPGAEGMKFYVLGPPRDEDLKYLKIEMDENEMYKLAAAGLVPAVAEDKDRLLQSGVILQKSVSPFGAEYALKGKDKSDFLKTYNAKDNKWRQIETDWLDAGTEVALALTKLTNNTSLALAIEFEGSGNVILLPADAQSGNWVSWHRPEVMSSLKTKGGKDTDELLANTVFYKVGHHLSHNGTASKSGLDKMTHDGLVAFAPLVQDKVPAVWGGAANFPAKGLYKVIVEKTNGKVLRTDMGWVTDSNGPQLREQLSEEMKKQLKQNFRKGACFYEYTIKG